MKTLSCNATRRRLQAFHDGELAVGEQIAVSSHVEWCQRCARALAEVREISSLMQAVLPGRATLSNEDAAVFTGTVVNRLKAEDDASLFSRADFQNGFFQPLTLGHINAGSNRV